MSIAMTCDRVNGDRHQARCLTDLRNHLDLHTRPHRNLRHTEGAAGVGALVAEYLTNQLAGAVGHQMLLGESGRGVDQAHQLDDARDFLQVAHRRLQGAQQVDGNGAGGLLAFGGGHVLAQLADPGLAVFFGDVAADEDEVAGAHEGNVGRRGRGDRGEGDVQFFELGLDGHDGVFIGACRAGHTALLDPRLRGDDESLAGMTIYFLTSSTGATVTATSSVWCAPPWITPRSGETSAKSRPVARVT